MNRAVLLLTLSTVPWALTLVPSSLLAQCGSGCGSPSGGGGHVWAPGGMMGPLNEPMKVTLVNPNGTQKNVDFAENSKGAPPGTNEVEFTNENGEMTPQPGEEADYSGEDGTGLKPKKCPPESANSGGPDPDVPSTDTKQTQGDPSTENNLDAPAPGQQGTAPQESPHLGSGGISPAPLQMKVDPLTSAIFQSHAEIRFSAGLGISDTSPRVSAGFLIPVPHSGFEAHRIEAYRVRSGTNQAVLDPEGTGGLVKVFRTVGETTVLTQVTSLELRVDFHRVPLSTPLPASPPTDWKRITITRLTGSPPAGFSAGWTFAVSYPGGGGLSNTTTTWITQPGSGTAKTRVISGGREETWSSSVQGSPAIRTATYDLMHGSVPVRKTIDTFELAPTGSERITSSTVCLDNAGNGLTTAWTYWDVPNSPHDGLVKSVINGDGSWTCHALAVDAVTETSTRLSFSPYGSTAPPNLANVNTFTAMETLANSTSSLCVAEYSISTNFAISGPDSGDSLAAGAEIMREKRIGNKTVEKWAYNPGSGCIETFNRKPPVNGTAFDTGTMADEMVLSSTGDWSPGGQTMSRAVATGKNGSPPLWKDAPYDFIDYRRSEYTYNTFDDTRTVTTTSMKDSTSTEVLTDMTVSNRTDGRPIRQERRLNNIPYEVTLWGYDGFKRRTTRTVNGVLRESWAYPPPVAFGAVTATTHAAEDGTRTTTEYDAFGRILRQVLHGSASASVFSTSIPVQPDLLSTWIYSCGPADGQGIFPPGQTPPAEASV